MRYIQFLGAAEKVGVAGVERVYLINARFYQLRLAGAVQMRDDDSCTGHRLCTLCRRDMHADDAGIGALRQSGIIRLRQCRFRKRRFRRYSGKEQQEPASISSISI